MGYGRDSQHSAVSPFASQPLNRVLWSTPLDLNPPYTGNDLFIHYGSPVITSANTVLLSVKTDVTGTFRIEARNGTDGSLKYTLTSDYTLPSHNWVPSYSPVLTVTNRVYYPGAGGTIYFRDQPDSPTGTPRQIAFYGISYYRANPAAYQQAIQISTPITSDTSGNIYFGYVSTGVPLPGHPRGIPSGIAKIAPSGVSWFVSAADAGGDATITRVPLNCAPALSLDQKTLYFAVSKGGFSTGYLASVDARNLRPLARIPLKDPATGAAATITDDASASPTIGPDGDVYYGVLESSIPAHNARGWLLHFNAALNQIKIPAAFGWDDTASIIPQGIINTGDPNTTYLLLIKYNNYAGVGSGDGVNKMAIVDPQSTSLDPLSGATVMRVIKSITGPTPDLDNRPAFPNAVREWCINSAVVDPNTGSALVNNEDGILYRWDFATNSFTEHVVLTLGIGEAYTPTLIGPDGTVYAINNAILFAVGR